jgi:acyl carrier protein
VERWDSLGHVNLMMALEQEFGLRINPQDAASMTSFEEVCQKLREALGATR